MSETVRSPEVRVRIKHAQTVRGWRCDETTVEVTQELPMDPNELTLVIRSLLYAAHQDGMDEASRRNAQEGRTP